jgi:tetratricopeptide (TPR) repeat protein
MWVALLLVAMLAQGAQQKSALDDPKFAETLKAFVAAPESAPARKALDAMLALYPKDPSGPMEVGRQLLMQRDPKRAEEFLRRAVDLAPATPQTHFALGLCLLAEEKPDLAEQSFRKALELSPNASDIIYNLAQALGSQRNIDEAERLFRKAVELAPDRALFQFSLGEALMHVGKNDEAIAAFKSAAELGKARRGAEDILSRGRALYDLGYMFGVLGRHSEAPAFFEEAIAQLPNNAEARAQYGIYLYRQKKYDQALVQLRQAVQLGPRHRQANLHFALCLKQLGHQAEADAYLKRFKDLQNEFENAEREAVLARMQENLAALGNLVPVSDKNPEKPHDDK